MIDFHKSLPIRNGLQSVPLLMKPRKARNRPRFVCDSIRRSSRKSVNPRDIPRDEPLYMGEWKFDERLNLLHAMKKYGHEDMDKLCEAVPSRTPNQIRSYIRTWLKLAQRVCKGNKDDKRLKITKHARLAGRIPLERDINPNNTNKAPLDQWLELIEDGMPAELREKSFLVAKAFKYISLFEVQPMPADCEGINFRAVYDFMYRMLNGLPYKNMDKETTQYILSLIKGLARHIACTEYKEYLEFLDTVWRVNLGRDNFRCYRGKKESLKKQNDDPDDKITPIFEDLVDEPGFNPLGFTMEQVKMVRNDEIDLDELLMEPIVVKTIEDLEKDFQRQVEKIYKKPVQWWKTKK